MTAFEVSIVRLYLLYRTATVRCSVRDLAADLRRRGVQKTDASIRRLLSTMERAGYVSSMAGAGSAKAYRATAKGKAAVKASELAIQSITTDDVVMNRPVR